MKAVVYKGAKQMQVENIDKPTIKLPTDMIVKVTSAAICGSDLHMYEGRTDFKVGRTLGHEIMGIVEEIGSGVTQLQKGDRVVLPFNVACGTCLNCVNGLPNLCYVMADGADAAAAWGFADMGHYNGGQAECVLVPHADFNSIKLPGTPFDEHEDDFLMLADIFPTAYQAAVLANVQAGHSTVIYGAGPVGLLAITASIMRGAADIYVVDHIASRLEKAKELGAIPINSDDSNPVEQIRKHRSYIKPMLRKGEDMVALGVMSGIDAVGYQAHDLSQPGADKGEDQMRIINDLTELVLPGGSLGVIGIFIPDPGSDADGQRGVYRMPFGAQWYKGHRIGTGQAPVKQYSDRLREVILSKRARPGSIVTHHITIDEAPQVYERFDKRETGLHKAVIQFK